MQKRNLAEPNETERQAAEVLAEEGPVKVVHLSEVVFPENLEKIEADAFTNCSLMADPTELTDAAIDPRAFYKTDYY